MLPKPLAYGVLAAIYAILTGIVLVLIPILKRDTVSRF